MSSEVDFYDVQSMVENAKSELRSQFRNDLNSMRDELRREMYDEVRSLVAMINSRTEHLA